MTWTRLDLGDLGRSLCDRPGHAERTVITVSASGYAVSTPGRARPLTCLPLWAVLGELTMRGVQPPTRDDFEWLKGGS